MGIRIEAASRNAIIFYLILAMLVGLFFSRALLSVGLGLFVIGACVHKNFLFQCKRFYTNPFLLGMALLFLLPFLSGLWSSNKQEWLHFSIMKLPLLLLPLAFAGPWQLTAKQWRQIAYCFLLLLLAGCCWSLWQYLQNSSVLQQQYLHAKLIPTLLDDDHVRYSLLVCIGVILSVLLVQNAAGSVRAALWVLAVFFTVYLHILSARTGLYAVYVFFTVLAVNKMRRMQPLRGLVLILGLLAMPLLAWLVLPTFRSRIQYNIFDVSHAVQRQYISGTSDGNRMASVQAGWHTLQHHAFGVGLGDVQQVTWRWYAQHKPQMLASDKLYPSSEWLMYGSIAGWAGVLLFTAVMIVPFFITINTHRLFFIALNLVAALSFVFDIGLSVQFGVFIYAFSLLWWYKWLNGNNELLS